MLTYGFYNSQNGDRRYDAEQFSQVFDGIINDGVFMGVGNHFNVVAAGNDMSIVVNSGRAWFDHTWTLNTAGYQLQIPRSEVAQDRIDAVILDVDHRNNYRKNQLMIVSGQRSTSPQKPTLIKEEYHKQYPLAYVYVAAGVTKITQANVTNAVGTSECPFVTGIIQTIDIDDLIAKWEVQWDQQMSKDQNEFNSWFANVKDTLDDTNVGELLNTLAWTTINLSVNNWSDTTVSNLGDGRAYYTYEVPLNHIYVDVPIIDRATSGTNEIQTEEEAEAFNLLCPNDGWVVADTETMKLTFYVITKPTISFNVRVQGVD